MRRLLWFLPALALVAAESLTTASAQDSTPTVTVAATLAATLQDTEGQTVAVALLAEGDDGDVLVQVVTVGLPGEHGIHVHETGVCDPTGERAFASAGGHYNPTNEEHGNHAGDLGNIGVDEDGTGAFEETTDNFTLDELVDEDGSSIVIHAEEDENDPEGESFGARIACGVLAAPVETEEPTATATETTALVEATPPVSADATTDAVDTDGDGLADADETANHGTDPAVVDSDGDGVGDGDEVAAGTDPLDPASV